jgi:RND family efflux transporter MFP subunit
LLQDGFTTRAAFDAAESDLHAAEAELDSARAQQSLAEENLSKADLVAPFDGTIARINASAFDIVSPGTPVVSIYSSTQFEVLFSVPSTIVNSLSEGNRAIVRVAQRRDLDLDAILTEVGSRTDGSNAFPVTATLINPAAGLKSGMAAEVVLEVPVADGASGFLVPFNALAFDQSSSVDEMAEGTRQARVFKYDPETETVVIQSVTISGVRDNMLIITGGLEIGDRIASAGVSFLSDGQAVTLFETE